MLEWVSDGCNFIKVLREFMQLTFCCIEFGNLHPHPSPFPPLQGFSTLSGTSRDGGSGLSFPGYTELLVLSAVSPSHLVSLV